MALINTHELCKILAGKGNEPLTKARVTQLEKEGMPKAGRDQWDAVQCMFWYLGKLRRSVKSRQTENEDGTSSSVETERKRLLRAQAEREELVLAKERGESLNLVDHERILSDMIQTTRAHVRAIAPRVAQDLVGETSRTMIQAKLEKAHDEALVALSRLVPRTMPAPPDLPPPPEPVKPKKKKPAAKKKPAPRQKPRKAG